MHSTVSLLSVSKSGVPVKFLLLLSCPSQHYAYGLLILNVPLCCPNDSRCYSAQKFRSCPSVANVFHKT